MPKALVIAELDAEGALRKSTLSAISFAKKALPALGEGFDILVLGAQAQEAAQALTGYGAGRILVCADPRLADRPARRRRRRRSGTALRAPRRYGHHLRPAPAAPRGRTARRCLCGRLRGRERRGWKARLQAPDVCRQRVRLL